MMEKLGIYIHIPFCAGKCGYCDFYSLAGCDHMMPDYHQALLQHIHESESAILRYDVDSVYFGGGTPSYYGAERIADIFNMLKLNGNVMVDSEVTCEVNPDSTDPEMLKLLRREGINRLSIGAQSANDDLLKLIGRRHTFRQVRKAVSDARDAGFENISLDLMYGLPSQTKNDWADTLAKAIELKPEHISCYALKLEPGTKMYNEYFGSPIIPDDDTQADMYCYAAEMLGKYGFAQYEISNFAVRGYESRHNIKYWTLEDYLGFGPGAHSCMGNQRFSYIRNLKEYIDRMDTGEDLIDERETVTPLERAVEYIMLAMRMTNGISEKEYRTKTQCDWRPIIGVLKIFEEKGWAVQEEDRWHFTVPGFLISNTLIGIMLEAQTTGRVDSIPWMREAYKVESRIALPSTEDEIFKEIYRQQVAKKKF